MYGLTLTTHFAEPAECLTWKDRWLQLFSKIPLDVFRGWLENMHRKKWWKQTVAKLYGQPYTKEWDAGI